MPASTIGADYYRFEEGRHALVGDRTGETYRLGDRVEVKLVEAAPVAGALRFELAVGGPPAGGPTRAGPGPAARAADSREAGRRGSSRRCRARRGGEGGRHGRRSDE